MGEGKIETAAAFVDQHHRFVPSSEGLADHEILQQGIIDGDREPDDSAATGRLPANRISRRANSRTTGRFRV